MDKEETKWVEWVEKNKEIPSHSFNIQIKPFPYSNNYRYKTIKIHPGFERTVRKKIAPNKPIPKFKSTELARKIARREELFR